MEDSATLNFFVVSVVLSVGALIFAVYADIFIPNRQESLGCLLLAILFALWAVGCAIDLAAGRIVQAIKRVQIREGEKA